MDTMYSQSAEAQEIQLWCDDRCDNKKRHEKHTKVVGCFKWNCGGSC